MASECLGCEVSGGAANCRANNKLSLNKVQHETKSYELDYKLTQNSNNRPVALSMTVEQREKIQHAIQALIDVESALHHGGPAVEDNPHLIEVREALADARAKLVTLNAPDYN